MNNINHPIHYNSHPSGIECIEVAHHMSFNLGNVIKYIRLIRPSVAVRSHLPSSAKRP